MMTVVLGEDASAFGVVWWWRARILGCCDHHRALIGIASRWGRTVDNDGIVERIDTNDGDSNMMLLWR